MTKMKTQQPITQEKGLTKHHSWNEGDALLHNPGKEEWRKRLIYSLREWMAKEDIQELNQFCEEYKLSYQTLYEWRNRYEDVNKAVSEAMFILGSRRRIGALKKDYDKDMVRWDIHIYDPSYKEIHAYHADLRNRENETKQNITVVIPPAVNSDRVPNMLKGEKSNDSV